MMSKTPAADLGVCVKSGVCVWISGWECAPVHDSVRACVCGSLSSLTGTQAAEGWVQLSQSSQRESEKKGKKNREILIKRCRCFGAIKHHWHMFHSTYFFLLNVPLFHIFFFHKAAFLRVVGVWLEERQRGYHGNKAHHRYEHPWWRSGEAITVSHWPHSERVRVCVCYGTRSNRGCAVLFSILWTKVFKRARLWERVNRHTELLSCNWPQCRFSGRGQFKYYWATKYTLMTSCKKRKDRKE